MKDRFDFDEGVFTHSQTFVNWVNLHYVTGGQGPLLLLWHGFLCSWFSWRKVMPKLAKNYTVIVPDMRVLAIRISRKPVLTQLRWLKTSEPS